MSDTAPPVLLEPDPEQPSVLRPVPPLRQPRPPLARPTLAFMASHPAHAIALGFGSGLARFAPGTVGTLWGWAAFVVLQPWLSDTGWAVLIAANLLLGWWACTVTARHMGQPDSSHMVWDEVVAIWLVLLARTTSALVLFAPVFTCSAPPGADEVVPALMLTRPVAKSP